MLPGTRTFTDEDVLEVHKEAFDVFDKLNEAVAIPDDFRVQVFASVLGMVGNRQVIGGLAGMPSMEIPRGKH